MMVLDEAAALDGSPEALITSATIAFVELEGEVIQRRTVSLLGVLGAGCCGSRLVVARVAFSFPFCVVFVAVLVVAADVTGAAREDAEDEEVAGRLVTLMGASTELFALDLEEDFVSRVG